MSASNNSRKISPHILAGLTALAMFSACRSDSASAPYADGKTVWALKELNGAPFPATATLSFPEPAQIAGQGPCNRYFGALKGSYPQFSAGPIGSTRMACPDLRAETAYLMAFEAVTRAQMSDGTLTLTGPDGLRMLFKPSG